MTSLVYLHIREATFAAMAEVLVLDEAKVMRAQANLRLVTFTDDELDMMAGIFGKTYSEFKTRQTEAIETCSEWLPNLTSSRLCQGKN